MIVINLPSTVLEYEIILLSHEVGINIHYNNKKQVHILGNGIQQGSNIEDRVVHVALHCIQCVLTRCYFVTLYASFAL